MIILDYKALIAANAAVGDVSTSPAASSTRYPKVTWPTVSQDKLTYQQQQQQRCPVNELQQQQMQHQI